MNSALCELSCYSNAGLPELLELIRDEDQNILDVGCGAGDNAMQLKARGRRVDGITLSATEFDIARTRMDRVILADIETWNSDYPEEEFDALLLSHVLEHLVDPPAALRRLLPLLRPGSRVYVALPNVLFWRQRLEFLAGRFDYTDAGTLDRTHLRFYTHASAKQLIVDAGLALVQTSSIGSAPLRPLRAVLPKASRAIDRMACRLWPNLFGHNVILVGEKPI